MKITVEIDNLTEPQKLAIEDLLAMWQHLGSIGGSRWTAFFADGDGDFRPKVLINGHKPEPCVLIKPKDRWKNLWYEDRYGQHPEEMYLIDFDEIAWAMHKENKPK